MQLRVALDIQHAFRGGIHAGDRGARFTVGGLAGAPVVWETDYSSAYARACALELLARGHQVLLNADGTPWGNGFVGPYSARQRRAMDWHADLYVACHVNAGGGDYGRVSWAGLTSSTAAVALSRALVQWRAMRVQRVELKPGDRGFVCLRAAELPLVAVLLEPFFGDDELAVPPGLELMPSLGRTLGQIIDQYAPALKIPTPSGKLT